MLQGAATTFTVNSTNDVDDGTCDSTHCSLREAINAANSNSGKDTVAFNISGAGPHTIQPTSTLPTITDPVVIDGYTQPGASANTNGPGLGSNAVLQIELDGTSAGASVDGLTITAGSSNVRGLVINRFGGSGMELQTNGGNVIEGNFVGTDVAGLVSLANDWGIMVTAPDNVVGGTTPETRNIISGSITGSINGGVGLIFPSATGNLVQGNFIGTKATGVASAKNGGHGVVVNQSFDNTIGGTAARAGNLISANGLSGIAILDTNGPNLVQGNLIGMTVDGTSPLGNGSHGVHVGPIERPPANTNTIGGSAIGAGNTIAYNGGDGVFVETGTDNCFLSNSIFSNTGLGIDLGADGVGANDPGDGDTGPNNLQNFPQFVVAHEGTNGLLAVEYSVDSATANSAYPLRVEFFEADTDGQEGKTFLGSRSYPASSVGSTQVAVLGNAAALGVASGDLIVATATDASNNTSEFSPTVQVVAISSIIPGLTQWGLVALAGVLAIALVWRLRRRSPAAQA